MVDLLPGAMVSLKFPYHPGMVDAAKKAGCWWHKDARQWRVHAKAAAAAAETFAESGAFGPELADQIRRVISSPACSRVLAAEDQQKLIETAIAIPDLARRITAAMPAGAPELYKFQQIGVGFAMVANGRAIIADEMGLGKTVQGLAYLAVCKQARPALIVAPPAALVSWERAIATWLGEQSHRIRSGSEDVPSSPIILCPWSLLSKQIERIMPLFPNACILDEGHYAKNGNTKRGDAVMRLASSPHLAHRLVLSGTPMLNRPRELYQLLHFCQPGEWGSEHQFFHQFCGARLMKMGHRKFWNYDGISNAGELSARLVPVMIRRMKAEVMKELPPKRSITVPIEADVEGLTLPPADLEKLKKAVALQDAGMAFAAMSTMRRLCGLAKVGACIEWAKDALETGTQKVVLFAHHADVQRRLNDGLGEYSPVWISGGMSPDQKGAAVDAFQKDPARRVIVCSLGAAREAITLTAANVLAFVERDYVPGAEDQASDRIHRIGQESPCTIVRLMSDHPVDMAIQEVIDRKRAVSAQVLGGVENAERRMSALHLDLAASMLKMSAGA
jgi:SWI/SNF-related matrix-associated actin-dependent regulator 1 of chromatin subfamily A